MKNLREIANELHLARSTVSMCLSSDLSRYRLSPETVARVRKYAEANGYVPNRLARKLSRSDDNAIGLLVLYESGSEKSDRALEMAIERLTQEGREFYIQNVSGHKLSNALLFFMGMRVRDVILFGPMREFPLPAGKPVIRNELRMDLKKSAVLLREMRIFSIDYSFPVPEDTMLEENIYRRGVNRVTTIQNLFDQLHHSGRQRIMCDINTSVWLPEEGNYLPDRRYILQSYDNRKLYENGRHCAEEFMALRRELQPEVVIFHNDRSAIGFIDALRRYGLSVPHDVEVIGFNNSEICDYYNPRLTSVRIPVEENAAAVLEAILNGRELDRTQLQDAEVIWRESATLDPPRRSKTECQQKYQKKQTSEKGT